MGENTLYRHRASGLLTALVLLSHTIFADVATPTPKRITDQPAVPAGTDWGFVISVGLFVLAGVLIVVWIVSKRSKRASK